MTSLPQVTYDRIKAVIEADELKYVVDENDGEIGIGFDNLLVWIKLDEHVLRLYAIWRGDLVGAEAIEKAKHFCNRINRDLILPKTVVFSGESTNTETSEGAVPTAKFMFEASLPIEKGLTDEQISAQYGIGMRSIMNTVEKVEEEYASLITWSEEEK